MFMLFPEAINPQTIHPRLASPPENLHGMPSHLVGHVDSSLCQLPCLRSKAIHSTLSYLSETYGVVNSSTLAYAAYDDTLSIGKYCTTTAP